MTGAGNHAPTRLEASLKASGQARYTCDTVFPNQLYAAVLRSPHARAQVDRIDATAARALRGVVDVLTPHDCPEVSWYAENVPLLGVVARFEGDEIAAVVATSEDIARDALRLIDVEYSVQQCVIGLDAATAAGASPVHAGHNDNRTSQPDEYHRGDIASGFREADVVVEASYSTPTAIHHALEAHACNAWWDGQHLNLWVSTQGIFAVREDVAEKLGLPLNRVRVRAQHVGGGFGAKQVAWKETVIAALLSMRTGRPVRLVLDRKAESLAAGNRNATRQHVKIGATRDGRLCAIDVSVEQNRGAYTVAGEASPVVGPYQWLYACANVRTCQTGFYTNTGPAVAFRGPGFVEGTFGLEQTMDELARELAIDPLELRRRNHTVEDQTSGKAYSSPHALAACYEALESACALSPGEAHSDRKLRGVGIAASVWMGGGANPPAQARVQILKDGSVTVVAGAQDIGTGTRTALAQVAAETLGVDVGTVSVAIGDTLSELRAPTSAGSATLASVGPAVSAAAGEARRGLLEAAAKPLACEVDGIKVAGGRIVDCDADRDTGLDVAGVAAEAPEGSLSGHGEITRKPAGRSLRTFAVQLAEVEVDRETGEISLVRVACAPDCGRIVNRALARSQVIGGVTQGIGLALMEDRQVDSDSGTVLNANLEDYLVPTAADVPPIEHVAVNLGDTFENTLGVKGLGEPPMLATAPAIANAVHAAIGVRIRHLPMTRRRLIEALADREETRS